jgi:hypothetical protein
VLAVNGGLPLDPNRAAQEVDVLETQCQQLTEAESEASLGDHHCLAARRHRRG